MTPTKLIFDRMVLLWAGNVATLGDPVADQMQIHFISGSFTPNLNLQEADLNYGAAGLAADAISVYNTAASIWNDPVSGSRIVDKFSAGGFWWVATSGLTTPITIYGWSLRGAGDFELWASENFVNPIALTADGQRWDEAKVRFTLPVSMIR